ncbi:hypothetical protein ANN_15445 [Periplaneta americana]|uniref:Uncharacterized protein n=1 Tax=Periplaneta americana TaxID=6978 RepID=A0ABQ8SGP0_PERAM|nr:hypothetical protein ANN_15445 [Periplaneta americana]
MDVCLDLVGPTHWEKKQKTSKEKVVERFPEVDWSAVDENSEMQYLRLRCFCNRHRTITTYDYNAYLDKII